MTKSYIQEAIKEASGKETKETKDIGDKNMWILVEVDNVHDIGLNENRRILLGDNDQIERNVLPFLFADASATEVPPATGGMSSSDLLRKMI